MLTLTLHTVCPRKFLCSQLAITCSIWARSKKSNCKGSGISRLKSMESRILRILRRTRNNEKLFYFSWDMEEKSNSKTELHLCPESTSVWKLKTVLKSKLDFISNIFIWKMFFLCYHLAIKSFSYWQIIFT